MKKVLIISYHFPPVNVIASKRYGTMCKYFAENGYKPYVLTTRHDETKGTSTRLDCELPIDRNQILNIGSVRRNVVFQNPCWNYVLSILSNWKYCSRTIEAAGIGWFEKVKSEIKIENLRDIDIIIGTFPPMANLYIAFYLSKKLKIPYIADIRDLISDYSETPIGYKHAFRLDWIMEKIVLQKAIAIVTVTSGFKDILKTRYLNKNIQVIYNGWDDRRSQQEQIQHNQTEKYLYYAGSFYLHRLESFELLIKCLKQINNFREDKIKFIIRSNGPENLNAKAKCIVQQEGMLEYVHVLSAVSEDIVREEQKNAYINIVLSSIHPEDKALMTTIPGKVYELLSEEVPILAIVSKQSDIEKILNCTNKGITSTNQKEIIDFILQKNKNYVGNEKIRYFSRCYQAKRLCKFMDRILINESNHY